MSYVLRAETLGKLTQDDIEEIEMILNRSTCLNLDYSPESYENTIRFQEGGILFKDGIIEWFCEGDGSMWSAWIGDSSKYLMGVTGLPSIQEMSAAYLLINQERSEHVSEEEDYVG